MNAPAIDALPWYQRWSLVQLVLSRFREFYREPEAVFWAYGFPALMVVALGIAFRNQPIERFDVDIVDSAGSQSLVDALNKDERFVVETHDEDACRSRLRTGRTSVVVSIDGGNPSRFDYWYDPARPESVMARDAVDDSLQRAAGRIDPAPARNHEVQEPGGRYIDFLVPGLLGMSLMGGGLWGVGFLTVDMRIRKLLKRLLATPMRKTEFLAAIMASRLLFLVPEVLILLVFARVTFGVVNQGNPLSVVVMILLGALSFAGIGLLVASRAKTIEAVSGLMNLVMLPMWMLSGIFFSSERFPAAAQPLIKALPLTQLIDTLRGIMLEGLSITVFWPQILALAAWGAISFVLALRWFRWS